MFLDWFLTLTSLICLARSLPLGSRDEDWAVKRTRLAFDIPLERRGTTSGAVGLGDVSDLLYTLPIVLGGTNTAVNLDTGSSDLWVISKTCKNTICDEATTASYASESFKSSGVSVTMNYGDSKTGTFASGPVGTDVVSIAGMAISQQPFAAVDNTTNTLVQQGASGILGLGFPGGSVIQASLAGATSTGNTLATTSVDGPLLSRLVMSGQLESPLFAVSLQTATVDISGNGQLTIGKLPNGVDNSSLTWVPVRLYTPAEGGPQPPPSAPNEIYPFRWEIEIDAVFLDGNQLPNSTIPPNGVPPTKVTAIIDTGNSLIRGPSDVVQNILTTVSPSFNPSSSSSPVIPCNVPHTLSFQIGGKQFPVDPRDFIGPDTEENQCLASNIVSTDPPSQGALFSWSLGDPFFKSNVIVFYYGNLTNPSVDPPRIGFLSTVPSDADSLLQAAVQNANDNGGKFESTLELAPTADVNLSPTSTIVIPSSLVAGQSSPTGTVAGQKNSASSLKLNSVSIVLPTLATLFLSGFLDDVFLGFQRFRLW